MSLKPLVFMSGVLFFCQAFAGGAAPPNDKEALQGVWTAKSMDFNGKPAPEAAVKWMRFTFRGDKVVVRGNHSDAHEDECDWTIDPAKTPKEIDITFGKGEKAALGIYELKGDELTICMQKAGEKKRPTEFTSKPDSRALLLLFEREKPQDTKAQDTKSTAK